MILEKHPLQGRANWKFSQPSTIFATTYPLRDLRTGEVRQQSLECNFSCREGLLNNVRVALQKHLMEDREGSSTWSKVFVQTGEIAFDDEKGVVPGKTYMSTHIPNHPVRDDALKEKYAAQLYKVANIVAGLPLLLLNPQRKPGEWATLPPRFKPVVENYARWFGVDNSLLRHPALLSVGSGLFRQAALLVNCHLAEEVIASAPTEEVERVLVEADWKAAFGLIDQVRPWIQILPGQGGNYENYPIPWTRYVRNGTSYWQRFIRLHRALRRHGFEDVLESFIQGWNLDGKAKDYSGAFSFWGADGKLSEAHKRVMLLGKPLKRKRIVRSV